MTISDKGLVTGISLQPCRDIDPILLATLSHAVLAVGNLSKFSINKVKAAVESQGVDQSQWKEIK